MSPLPSGDMHGIQKRWIYYGGPYDGDNGWYNWGRWVLLGVIIGIAVLFFLALQCTSCRRVRRGQQPIRGTQWMLPPSYHVSQQQYQNDYSLPTYKPQPGEGDAGTYHNGQFVPSNTAQASQYDYYRPSGYSQSGYGQSSNGHSSNGQGGAESGSASGNFQPPSGPPPNHYQPPPGPPPGQSEDPQAPPTARYKN